MPRTNVPFKPRTLPAGLCHALASSHYRGSDVPVMWGHTDSVAITDIANDGCRAVVVIVGDVDRSDTCNTYFGSWGGANAFAPSPLASLGALKIPERGAIVRGTAGNRCDATIYVTSETWLRMQAPSDTRDIALSVINDARMDGRPDFTEVADRIAVNALAVIRTAAPVLTKHEQAVLDVYAGIKSSYRKEYLDRIPNAGGIVESLIATGMLKRASNGATQITTKGKNSRSAPGKADIL